MTRVEVILILGDTPSERKGAAKLAEAQEAIIWRRESVVMALSLPKSHAGTSLQQFGFNRPWRWRRLKGMKQMLVIIAAAVLVGCGSASSVKSNQRTMMRYVNVAYVDREVDCQLIGTNHYYPEFTQSKIVAGRFLSEVEENSKAMACVISLELAQRLFAEHNPLMEKVVVRSFESSQVFQVMGILEQRVDTEKLPQLTRGEGHSIAAKMYIPLSTFKQLYGVRDLPDKKPREESKEPLEPPL